MSSAIQATAFLPHDPSDSGFIHTLPDPYNAPTRNNILPISLRSHTPLPHQRNSSMLRICKQSKHVHGTTIRCQNVTNAEPTSRPRSNLKPSRTYIRSLNSSTRNPRPILWCQPHHSIPRRPQHRSLRRSLHAPQTNLRNKHLGRSHSRRHPTTHGLVRSSRPKRNRIRRLAGTPPRRTELWRLALSYPAVCMAIPALQRPELDYQRGIQIRWLQDVMLGQPPTKRQSRSPIRDPSVPYMLGSDIYRRYGYRLPSN